MTLREGVPQVLLVAYTVVDYDAMNTATEMAWDYRANSGYHYADDLAEFAGRNCYQSWNNPAGRTNAEYLGQQIVGNHHYSVLEHASATFHISQVSRSLLTELTRHRHLSFSVLSQRYVDETDGYAVVPPDIAGLDDPTLINELHDADRDERARYWRIVNRLQETHGFARKDARSAARAVLPNMTETQLVVTGNHRTWREVLSKRLAPGADAEIRRLCRAILVELYGIAPATYQDLKDEFNV